MYPLLWLATITTLLNWLHLWGLLSPEVPLSFPHMHATSHLLTGAHTCKWQSVAGIIKVEVPWKRTAGLLELQEAFFMIQSHCEQPIEEGKDSDVMKSVSEIIFEGAFQKLANKKKNTEEEATRCVQPCPYYAHRGFLAGLSSKPLREIWLSSVQQSSIPWCHCDSRWKTNTDYTSGKQSSHMQQHNTDADVPKKYSI